MIQSVANAPQTFFIEYVRNGKYDYFVCYVATRGEGPSKAKMERDLERDVHKRRSALITPVTCGAVAVFGSKRHHLTPESFSQVRNCLCMLGFLQQSYSLDQDSKIAMMLTFRLGICLHLPGRD
jgi:hypothetical protein